MNLTVIFHNPNPNGQHIVRFQDIHDYHTDKGELIIEYRPDDPQPTIFACRQWIWAEANFDSNGESPRTDRHHPNEEETRPANSTSNRRANPNGDRNGRRSARASRPSDINDYAIVLPEDVERTHAASVEFAIDNRTVPWSEAHMRKLLEYEKEVREQYGQDTVDQLPWNKVPRGEEAKRRQ